MYCLFVIILYVIFEFGLCLFFFVIDNCGYGNDWVVMIDYIIVKWNWKYLFFGWVLIIKIIFLIYLYEIYWINVFIY